MRHTVGLIEKDKRDKCPVAQFASLRVLLTKLLNDQFFKLGLFNKVNHRIFARLTQLDLHIKSKFLNSGIYAQFKLNAYSLHQSIIPPRIIRIFNVFKLNGSQSRQHIISKMTSWYNNLIPNWRSRACVLYMTQWLIHLSQHINK